MKAVMKVDGLVNFWTEGSFDSINVYQDSSMLTFWIRIFLCHKSIFAQLGRFGLDEPSYPVKNMKLEINTLHFTLTFNSGTACVKKNILSLCCPTGTTTAMTKGCGLCRACRNDVNGMLFQSMHWLSWVRTANKRTKKIIKRSDCAMVTLNGKSLETLNGDRHCHATGSRRKNSGGQFNHAYVALLL